MNVALYAETKVAQFGMSDGAMKRTVVRSGAPIPEALLAIASLVLTLALSSNATPITLKVTCDSTPIGTVIIDPYKLTGEVKDVNGGTQNKGPWGASIQAKFVPLECPEGKDLVEFRWIQMVTTNAVSDKWKNNPPPPTNGIYTYIDPWMQEWDPKNRVWLKDEDPFYRPNKLVERKQDPDWAKGSAAWFDDSPDRDDAYVYQEHTQSYVPAIWEAETALVCIPKDGEIRFLGSFKWGWERYYYGGKNTFVEIPIPSGDLLPIKDSSPLIAKATDSALFPGWSKSDKCCCPDRSSTLVLFAVALAGCAVKRHACKMRSAC